MKLWHVERLSDRAAAWRLMIRCRQCKHARSLPARELLDRHGDLTIIQLKARFRCIACGKRDMEAWADSGP